ncbi:hypothetical protein HC761_01220 [bacterium]|nr:hypothetical protein [bacterium]
MANAPVIRGLGFFTSSVTAGQPQLYQLELNGAVASALGAIASGGDDLDSLVVTQVAPRFALSANSVEVMESAVPAQITITRSGGGPLILSYATADGTALAGSDYTAVAGTLFFGANDSSASITVPILLDAVEEPSESFLINLQTGTGETIALTVRIVSDQIFANGFE